MDTRTYTLHELAEITGIEPRTIRSYITRGLLPGPLSRGRNAHYSELHLQRLLEIQALKEQGIPLREIRLGFLHGRPTLDEAVHHRSPSRARRVFPILERGTEEDAPLLRLLRILQNAVRTRAAHRRSKAETWTHVEVTPEIQLQVRGELSESERELVRRIADHMREILLS